MSKKSPVRGEKAYSPTGILGNFSGKLLCISTNEQPLLDVLATSFSIHVMSEWAFTKLFKLNLFFNGVVLEIYYISQILVTNAEFELRPILYNAAT